MLKDVSEIIKAIKQKRAFELDKAQAFLQQLCLIDKTFLDLEKAYRKCIINGKGSKTALEKRNNYLKSKNLLQHVSPAPHCSICHDTGMKNSKPCICAINQYNREFCSNSEISKYEFDKIDFDVYGKNAPKYEKIVENLKKYCKAYPNFKKQRNLALIGHSGNGKTYLLSCIANEIRKKNYSIIYINALDLNQKFLLYHTTFDESKQSVLEPILKCEMLLIDDIGQEPQYKNVTCTYFQYLFNYRLEHNLAFAFTSNLLINDFTEKYGETISSRLFDKNSCCIIGFNYENLRNIL